MLLGDAHVETAAGVALHETGKARAIGHGRGHGADLGILGGEANQGLGKDAGIARSVRRRLGLLARHHIKSRGGMAFVLCPLGRGIAFALLGDRMDQNRPMCPRLDGAKNSQKLVHIVPVDGADIAEAQLFKERATHGHVLEHIFGALGPFAERLGQKAHRAFGGGFQFLKRLARIEAREIGRHGAYRLGNRHLVVVEDDKEPLFQVARVVHRLKGHAAAQRPIPDHRDRIAKPAFALAAQIARSGKAQRGRDRGRGMGGAEGIVDRLGSFGEPGKPALLPQGADTVAAAGQDLVGIALVAHVPDDLVFRRIENRVQRHGQLDHAKPSAQMPAGFRDRADRLGAQLTGQLNKLGIRQGLHVGGRLDLVQKRCGGSVAHGRPCYLSRAITKRATSRKVSASLP